MPYVSVMTRRSRSADHYLCRNLFLIRQNQWNVVVAASTPMLAHVTAIVCITSLRWSLARRDGSKARDKSLGFEGIAACCSGASTKGCGCGTLRMDVKK